ncbi:hypothetical protein DB30_02955 [Enhygromyxa salina]|uniref:Uncharacterized protein n=1 Tax=Enhygromyxa salina TaxID=215803 RepID=A0A0C2D7T5_9BACT|nr:hypothetical protein [Enhygromyxa salina]KIG17680.1 hypothetical protein DB30_02955 [Enhygromyxa salina]
MTSLDWLSEQVRQPIDAAKPAIVRALANHLIAVCLIGPAAKRGRSMRGAHVELLIVAELLDATSLRALAKGLAQPLRAGLQIRTVTGAELAGSVDVHALEIATWRDHHLLLAGRDPFQGLEIAAKDLRHEIERALRTLTQRLRNRMLWCLATEQVRLDALLREGMELLTMIGHHTLALAGQQPPRDEAALLGRLLAWAGSSVAPVAPTVMALRSRLEATRAPDDPLAELAALATTTEVVCARVDALRV